MRQMRVAAAAVARLVVRLIIKRMSFDVEKRFSKVEYLYDNASMRTARPSRPLSNGSDYDRAYLDNNPLKTSRDPCKTMSLQRNGNASSGDLKELFSRFDIESKVIPWDIIARTRELCAKYLSGSWNKVTPQRFRLKAITGGMSNLLFLVEMPDDIEPISTEPRSALLRIHCNVDLEHLLNESVVFTLLSERALGPKLLGVFPGGRFEQYIPSRPLLCHELSLPSISRRIGCLLARVHALDVPIMKEPMIVEVAEGWLAKLRKVESKVAHKMRLNTVQVDLSKCPSEITCELLSDELDLLRACLENSDSPLVFCHNDLQEGNILLHNKYTIDSEGNLDVQEGEEPLVLIDFEYANYNYRGFDFSNHICERILDYSDNKPPYYSIKQHQFPDEKEQSVLFNAYLDELEQMTNNSSEDRRPPYFVCELPKRRDEAVEQLLTETRRFIAVSHLFWSVWSFMQAEESPIEFDYVSYGLDRLALYYEHKSDLLEYLQ
uniref:Choline/ethanolamine kinase n=1 Tax=Ascaris lumbricoides TaxID=6252 RepID=A0A0M3HN56_ASCLU